MIASAAFPGPFASCHPTDPMKPLPTALVVTALMMFGCRTIPGRDVRYEPTPMNVVRAMLELAEVGPDDVVYDLGSGDGRIPITAAKEFGARGVGIDIDPALVAQAQANARVANVENKVEFRLGDMYAADVRPATVVMLFLHPNPNLKLRPKLRSDLQPGARIVSYIWDMDDWAPDEIRKIGSRRIFLWRIPAAAAPTDARLRPRPIGRNRVFPTGRCPMLAGWRAPGEHPDTGCGAASSAPM
jgi:SAM-dependent methyltransferase